MPKPTVHDRPPLIEEHLAINLGPPVPGERWHPPDELVEIVNMVVETGDINLIIRTLAVVRQVAGHLKNTL